MVNLRPHRWLVPLGLVALYACGFVDGEPLVSGPVMSSSGSSTGAPSSSTQMPTTGDGLDSTSMSVSPSTSSDGETTSGSETGSTAACGCDSIAPEERCVRLVNTCDRSIDAGLRGTETGRPLDISATLEPGECVAVAVTELVGGRAFARLGCVDGICDSDGNDGRGTLVQFSLQEATADVYDVSLVGGFNLPMAMVPVGVEEPPEGSRCQSASCAADLNVVCPEGLVRTDAEGEIAYCTTPCDACTACPACTDCGDLANPVCSPCSALADLCCTEQECAPNEHTMLWKSLCPDAITDLKDGTAFVCDQAPDYDVVFCP